MFHLTFNSIKLNFPCISFQQTEQFLLLWILFTIIVLGNISVLITLSSNKNKKSRMNYFIKQLAIAGNNNFQKKKKCRIK